MSTVATWPSQAETWLDERGKGAWIVAMVLGFIFFWPIGLALLAYMIWSKRMFSNCSGRSRRHHRKSFRTSGNAAFEAYKSDTLARLEQEQADFEAFMKRLRDEGPLEFISADHRITDERNHLSVADRRKRRFRAAGSEQALRAGSAKTRDRSDQRRDHQQRDPYPHRDPEFSVHRVRRPPAREPSAAQPRP